MEIWFPEHDDGFIVNPSVIESLRGVFAVSLKRCFDDFQQATKLTCVQVDTAVDSIPTQKPLNLDEYSAIIKKSDVANF